jgi:hypothetical protein
MEHIEHAPGTPARAGRSSAAHRPLPRRGRIFVRRHPWLSGIAGALVAILALAYVVGFAVAEPLRKVAERRMNEALVGYKLKIGGLRLNIFGLGMDLLDITLVQTSHPNPPVAKIPRFATSIQWGALLSGKVVGDLVIDSPRMFLNLTQARTEASDPKKLDEHGWQEAVERVYPLKINALEVRHGEITYDDGSDFAPIHATDVHLLTQNIRNVSSHAGTYPSPLRFDAVVFDTGKARFDGEADYLAKPQAALRGDFSLASVPLSPFTPIARRYAIEMEGGKLSVDGHMESAAKSSKVDLAKVSIDGIKANFVKEGTAGERGGSVAKKAAHGATEPKSAPSTIVNLEQLHLSNGELGYVDRETDPNYRLFISRLDVTVRNFSNQKKAAPGKAQLKGAFMGSGTMKLDATFQPTDARADFATKLEIKDVDMTAMNDVLRARGGFDVASGHFSMYSELDVRGGKVDGYVKPIFSDLDVYDRRQDSNKNIFRQAYEGIVGGIGSLLENRPRDEVATVTDLSGRIDNPETSTFEIILGLLQNAFVRAILPGLERESAHG